MKFFTSKNISNNSKQILIFKMYISPQATEIYDFAGRNFE